MKEVIGNLQRIAASMLETALKFLLGVLIVLKEGEAMHTLHGPLKNDQ